MSRNILYAMSVVFLFTFSCTNKKKSKEKPKAKPNFIFIMVDDLGKEWVSSYGATEIETPNIDALATTGIKFNNAYSMPQCTPSRVALLTGQYPYVNGWVNHYDVPRWGNGANFDADKNPSFAKKLKQTGYRTCVAGKWQINDFRIEPDALEKAGFDDYCMWTGYESGNPASGKRYWNPYIFTKEGSRTYEGAFGPDIFTDFIINFMNAHQAEPMFIYYPMVLTHTPFVHTPLQPNAKTKYEKHKAMVGYTDFIIGKLVNSLKANNLMENTYLIFTTDNGTAGQIIGKRNGSFIRGGKSFLTENGINAPFIVITPDKLSYETNALIDFTDLYATFLDLAGIEDNTNEKSDGHSFANVLLDKKQESQREWVLSMGGLPAVLNNNRRVENYHKFRQRIIRNQEYKAYLDTSKQIHRIFNLKKDPYETENLIDQKEVTATLEKFQAMVNMLPNEDGQPIYEKKDTSFYNIPIQQLNKMAERPNKRASNMRPLASEEDFLKISAKEKD